MREDANAIGTILQTSCDNYFSEQSMGQDGSLLFNFYFFSLNTNTTISTGLQGIFTNLCTAYPLKTTLSHTIQQHATDFLTNLGMQHDFLESFQRLPVFSINQNFTIHNEQHESNDTKCSFKIKLKQNNKLSL